MKLLHPIGEAATLLSLSRSKVYELISDGDLQVIKIGKSARIEHEELERFIARMRNKSYDAA